MRYARFTTMLAAAVFATGCADNHSALNPAGPRAQHIADLLLLFCAVSAVVYLIVNAVLVWSMIRKRETLTPEAERKSTRVITAATALTVLILLTLALADFVVQRGLQAHPADALRIVVTGHQYWWEVQYDDPQPSQRLLTANELHIPVGRPVELVLTSQDVIHSFWLPNVMGKKDLIPGHTNTEVLIVDKPGTYRGQCAEFCGLQHAQMRLVVHADPPDAFEQWKQQQLAPAHSPANPNEQHGQHVFLTSSCILCHSIQGTDAGATVGPDLTHIASRSVLAAGTMPNNAANLSGWILAPHRFKPGVQMPATALPPDDLAALTAYLGSLQ
jgi:cytochrome c oxidase subunit II